MSFFAAIWRRAPGGGMAEMDESDFADMVEQTPVRTYLDRISRASVNGSPAGWSAPACRSAGDGLS
jgi:arginine-tRNA-protein transferase